jgi:hypothetical protein
MTIIVWTWEKPQISPLRYALVEMTILLQRSRSVARGETHHALKQNCHLDRSAAKWRDLRFLPVFQTQRTLQTLQYPDGYT